MTRAFKAANHQDFHSSGSPNALAVRALKGQIFAEIVAKLRLYVLFTIEKSENVARQTGCICGIMAFALSAGCAGLRRAARISEGVTAVLADDHARKCPPLGRSEACGLDTGYTERSQ